MLVLFPADPLQPRRVDPSYADEAAACRTLSIATAQVSYELLVDQEEPERAVQAVPAAAAPLLAVYRGWMLRPTYYAALYAALLARNVRLINDPAAYQHAHHLPASYAAIASHTPRSVWLPVVGEPDLDAIVALLAPFGAAPLVVKDYVKSRKHEWAEACFIPSAADRAAVERVVRRLLALQGDDLNEGLVFREYVPFASLGSHPRSGMPLTREYRLFVLAGAVVCWLPSWDEADYGAAEPPPVDQLRPLAARVQSRFFTMDVAQRRDGPWLIVELGDGQVAGLPARADAPAFYQALRAHWPTAAA